MFPPGYGIIEMENCTFDPSRLALTSTHLSVTTMRTDLKLLNYDSFLNFKYESFWPVEF